VLTAGMGWGVRRAARASARRRLPRDVGDPPTRYCAARAWRVAGACAARATQNSPVAGHVAQHSVRSNVPGTRSTHGQQARDTRAVSLADPTVHRHHNWRQ
jgi:hypothetical protein